jgi:hypothetical protein
MPFTTDEIARQFTIKLIECRPHLPEHADALVAVLTKLSEASRELAPEPGERRNQVIKDLAGQMQISRHHNSPSHLRNRVITQHSQLRWGASNETHTTADR